MKSVNPKPNKKRACRMNLHAPLHCLYPENNLFEGKISSSRKKRKYPAVHPGYLLVPQMSLTFVSLKRITAFLYSDNTPLPLFFLQKSVRSLFTPDSIRQPVPCADSSHFLGSPGIFLLIRYRKLLCSGFLVLTKYRGYDRLLIGMYVNFYTIFPQSETAPEVMTPGVFAASAVKGKCSIIYFDKEDVKL